jgi:hypothetical protein
MCPTRQREATSKDVVLVIMAKEHNIERVLLASVDRQDQKKMNRKLQCISEASWEVTNIITACKT